MTKFRANIQRAGYMLMDDEMRVHPESIEFLYAALRPSQDKNSYDRYSPKVTYFPGDRVEFKFKVMEVEDNSATSGGITGEMPIINNQIRTDTQNGLQETGTPLWKEVEAWTVSQIAELAEFKQTFSGQVIYLEHYLNAVLNNNSIDPYSINGPIAAGKQIFIEDASERNRYYVFRKSSWPLLNADEVYLYRKWKSGKNYQSGDLVTYQKGPGQRPVVYEAQVSTQGDAPDQNPAIWKFADELPFLFRRSYYNTDAHFIVWVPTEVKDTLPSSNWEDIVRSRVDEYVISGRKYNVQTF